jgi:hypothetical protein
MLDPPQADKCLLAYGELAVRHLNGERLGKKDHTGKFFPSGTLNHS